VLTRPTEAECVERRARRAMRYGEFNDDGESDDRQTDRNAELAA